MKKTIEEYIKDKYYMTPLYGFIPKEKIRFCDKDLFDDNKWEYVTLRKIKLWYGSSKSEGNNIYDKWVLGIQCEYLDLKTGKLTTTEEHCGELVGDNIEVKELKLNNNDYFNKFNIDFDITITHLKFETKKGESIEVGKESELTKKTVFINNIDDAMIHTFTGVYSTIGLRALGCTFIRKEDFFLNNFIDILRLRHLFINNDEERKKWEDPQALSELSIEMRAIVKLCNLCDENFIYILKYLII